MVATTSEAAETTPEKTTPAPAADTTTGAAASAAETWQPGQTTAASTAPVADDTATEVELPSGGELYAEEGLGFLAQAGQAIEEFVAPAATTAKQKFSQLLMGESTSLSLGANADVPPIENVADAVGDADIPSVELDENENPVREIEVVPEDGEPPGGTLVRDYKVLDDGSTGQTTTNAYNAEGQIVSTVTRQANAEDAAERTETVTYELNNQGQIAESTTIIAGGNGEEIGNYTSTYERNEKGQILSKTTRQEAGDEKVGSEKTTYTYDDEGRVAYTDLEQRNAEGQVARTERGKYDAQGDLIGFASEEQVDGKIYTSIFKPDPDTPGNIIRNDQVRLDPPPEGGDGVISRAETISSPDGTTNQVFEMFNPETGNPTGKQKVTVRADGSIIMSTEDLRANDGTVMMEAGGSGAMEYPPGTAQSMSSTGSVKDGTRNLFMFGEGSVSTGINNVTNIGWTVEGGDPKATPFEKGRAKLLEFAESSTNPDATIESVMAAFGEFGRNADDPLATRPSPNEGVARYREIGRDADKSITDLTSADKTLYYVGDGSFFKGMNTTQQIIGEGSTRRAIDTARADSPDGTMQGGLKQYGRYAPTFAESMTQIDRADPTSRRFSDDRTAIISLHEGPVPAEYSAFQLGTNVVEAADDTKGDRSLSSGMSNLLFFGDGRVDTAGVRLRATAEDGKAITGVGRVRDVSDDQTFRGGAVVIDRAGDGDIDKGIYGIKYFLGDGSFRDGGVTLRYMGNGSTEQGVDVSKVAGNGSAYAGMESINKNLGDGDGTNGAYVLVEQLGDGNGMTGAQQLNLIGDGDAILGAETVKYKIGGGSGVEGGRVVNEVLGDGSGVAGTQSLLRIGDNSGQRGADALVRLGGGGETDGPKGAEVVNRLGGGSGVEGSKVLVDLGGGESNPRAGANGVEVLETLGGGQYKAAQGVDYLETLGGGKNKAPEGAQIVITVGGGDGANGAKAIVERWPNNPEAARTELAAIGGGSALKGAEIVVALGGGAGTPNAYQNGLKELERLGGGTAAPNAVQNGVRELERIGNGDVVAGATIQGTNQKAAGAYAVSATGTPTGAEATRAANPTDTGRVSTQVETTHITTQPASARVSTQPQAERIETETARIAANSEAVRLATNSEATRIATQAEPTRIATQAEPTRITTQAEATRITTQAEATRIATQAEITRLAATSDPTKSRDGAPNDPENPIRYVRGVSVGSTEASTGSPTIRQQFANNESFLRANRENINSLLENMTKMANAVSTSTVPGAVVNRFNSLGQPIDINGKVIAPIATGTQASARDAAVAGRQLFGSIIANVRDASINVTSNNPGARQPGIGEVHLSRGSADGWKSQAQAALGASAGETLRTAISNSVMASFTWRGAGGADVTLIRMADGRVMIISRQNGHRGTGFTIDGAAAVAATTLVGRRFSVKGGDSVSPETKRQIYRVLRRKFKKRKLTGVEIALAVLLTSAAVARRLESAEAADQGEDLNSARTKQVYATLTRPTWLVRPNEDLVKLATHLFHDGKLGYLIADLNAAQIKESYVEGKRIVELKERQKIELPVWQDIVEFKKQPTHDLRPEDLITVVSENAIDTELIHAALAPVMGISKGKLAPATLRPATAAAAVSQVVSVPTPAWTFADPGFSSVSLSMARKAAVSVARSNESAARRDADQVLPDGAVATTANPRTLKRLREKYVG